MIRAAALWFALAAPSFFIVHKYGGSAGAVAYAVVAAIAAAAAPQLPVPRSRRIRLLVALATIAVFVTVFAVIYPRVNVQTPGMGSDDDDAYNAGVRALLDGRDPYGERTYLGNLLHQLPGAFVLAAPFVIAGTSALQNLLWLPAFFVAIRKEIDDAAALRLSWLVLAMSPTVMHQVVTGTGHVANTIYVAMGLWWLSRTAHPSLAGGLWGVAIASRANFLLLLPLAFAWLWQHRGRWVAARAILCACLAVTALVVPFYVHDPAHFGPLEAADRLLRFNAVFPYAGAAIAVLMAFAALALSCLPMDRQTLFAYCAVVEAVPVIGGVLLSGWNRRALWFATYGTFAAWFVFIAAADRFAGKGSSRGPIPGAPRTASGPAIAADPART